MTTTLSPFDGPCMVSPGIPRMTRYVPHEPHPAQRVFCCLSTLEAFYGGAAGGGKSDALLMAALQFVDEPGYAALILRKTYPDLTLPGALISRAAEWLAPTDARYHHGSHTWHFPSGATITFGYVQNDADVQRYRSAEFQFIGLDESTQHSEMVYRFLFSRLRRLEGSQVPLRMRSASNPGDVGHAWHLQRFIDPWTNGDVTRPFIPAKLEDNPSLDIAAYERSLYELDPVNYHRLRFGDWTVRDPGEVFDKTNVTIVDEAWPDARHIRVVRRWDFASTEVKPGKSPDFTAGVRLALDTVRGLWQVQHIVNRQVGPTGVEALLVATAEQDGRYVPIVAEREGGATGKLYESHIGRNILRGYRFEGEPATGNKELRIRALVPIVERREVEVVRGEWNAAFLDQMDAYPHVKHDDMMDAFAGAHSYLSNPGSRLLV